MSKDYENILKQWAREVLKRMPELTGNPRGISDAILDAHFVEIYEQVAFTRYLVGESLYDLVREWEHKGETSAGVEAELFTHYGIEDPREQKILIGIGERKVYVPKRRQFVDVYDKKDCSNEDLLDAALYLELQAQACVERANYLKALAAYRENNQ